MATTENGNPLDLSDGAHGRIGGDRWVKGKAARTENTTCERFMVTPGYIEACQTRYWELRRVLARSTTTFLHQDDQLEN